MGHIHELIDFTVAAYIVNKNRVLLVNHKKLSKWIPVGGHVELHEDTDQALIREIKEECGLSVEIINKKRKQFTKELKPLITPNFIDIHEITGQGEHRHINLVYFAKSKKDKIKLAEKEHNDIKWFSKRDLEEKQYKILPDVKFYANEALKLAK